MSEALRVPETLPVSMEQIEEVEDHMLHMPGKITAKEFDLTHHFAPGIYMREIVMPAGLFIVGHRHLHQHHNLCLSGRALVNIGGRVEELIAPSVFKSESGVRKILLILETMRFVTVHPNPTNETDIEKLSGMFIEKSDAFLEFEKEERELIEAAKQIVPK